MSVPKKTGAAKSSADPGVSPTVAPTIAVPLLYADAVGNVIMSPVNTRITLVLHKGVAKDGAQPAVPALELVIPTAALLTFVGLVEQHVKTQGPELSKALEEVKRQFEQYSNKK